MLNGKVRDTNVAHLAGANKLLHLAPSVEIVPVLIDLLLARDSRSRPVNKVQVHVIGAQVLQAGVNGLADALVVGVVELRREPDLVARNARVLDALADCFLISVGRCRVQVAVSSLQSSFNSLCNFAGLGLPGTQSNGGDFVSRVKGVGASERRRDEALAKRDGWERCSGCGAVCHDVRRVLSARHDALISQ